MDCDTGGIGVGIQKDIEDMVLGSVIPLLSLTGSSILKNVRMGFQWK